MKVMYSVAERSLTCKIWPRDNGRIRIRFEDLQTGEWNCRTVVSSRAFRICGRRQGSQNIFVQGCFEKICVPPKRRYFLRKFVY